MTEGHQLRLFNSMGRRLEDFVPAGATTGIYTCGPTVYSYQHLGNMRPYVFADTLRRALRWKSIPFHHVINITDVGHAVADSDTGEDKLEVAAARERRSVADIAAYYADVWFQDLAALNVAAARTAARGWLAYCHGTSMNEPAYVHLPHRLVVERLLLCPDGTTPLEHRVSVFDGRVAFIRTTTSNASGRPCFGDVHDRDWTRLPITWESPAHPVPLPRPARLAEMIELAERLGAGLSQSRVDIYDCGDRLMVGEITLYSQSGLVPYPDPAHDLALGEPWIISRPMLRAILAVAVGRWEIRPPRT